MAAESTFDPYAIGPALRRKSDRIWWINIISGGAIAIFAGIGCLALFALGGGNGAGMGLLLGLVAVLFGALSRWLVQTRRRLTPLERHQIGMSWLGAGAPGPDGDIESKHVLSMAETLRIAKQAKQREQAAQPVARPSDWQPGNRGHR
ncbi:MULTISPECIES: hypothetical protein [unclassified Luteococcus]|uniref:hypothetical protein n=1 Tax=unclassified Luteococcus TaxID=2639923 RepID=UPI00313B62DA